MPLTQNPIVEWPTEFHHLLAGFEVATGGDGKRFGRVDIDIDPETLFLLNDFEAHVRHRQVRLRLADSADCLVGEMNVLIGLGAAADRPGTPAGSGSAFTTFWTTTASIATLAAPL